MIVLGITGGVGSGKSRVLYDLEKNYDAYIVEADKLAHKLMEPGRPIYREIIRQFGADIVTDEAPYLINREKLGKIVFSDREKLAMLDSITHPLVKEEILRQIDEKKTSGDTCLFVIEAALLIQDGYKDICDEIWYIWVPQEIRITRLMAQRGYTRERCLSMFQSQESDEYYKRYADFTINNQFEYKNSSKQLNARLNKLLHGDIMT